MRATYIACYVVSLLIYEYRLWLTVYILHMTHCMTTELTQYEEMQWGILDNTLKYFTCNHLNITYTVVNSFVYTLCTASTVLTV